MGWRKVIGKLNFLAFNSVRFIVNTIIRERCSRTMKMFESVLFKYFQDLTIFLYTLKSVLRLVKVFILKVKGFIPNGRKVQVLERI